MTTRYVIKKCKMFGFSNSIKECLLKHEDNKIYLITDKSVSDIENILLEDLSNEDDNSMDESSDEYGIFGDEESKNTNKYDNIWQSQTGRSSIICINNISLLSETVNKNKTDNPIIIVDLTSSLFEDIHISVNKKFTNENNNNVQQTIDDLKVQATGNSNQLDAFTSNMFTVIYGKKDAHIQSYGIKQNHDVIDSLARAGVPCSPVSDMPLSIEILISQLYNLNDFTIIEYHDSLETQYILHEYPSDISHPSYEVTKGEITAVLYRYILINFFGYCSIVTESMRENKYNI